MCRRSHNQNERRRTILFFLGRVGFATVLCSTVTHQYLIRHLLNKYQIRLFRYRSINGGGCTHICVSRHSCCRTFSSLGRAVWRWTEIWPGANNSTRKSRRSFKKSGNFPCKCIDKGPEGLDWLLSDVVRDAVRYMSWRMTESGRHSIRGVSLWPYSWLSVNTEVIEQRAVWDVAQGLVWYDRRLSLYNLDILQNDLAGDTIPCNGEVL